MILRLKECISLFTRTLVQKYLHKGPIVQWLVHQTLNLITRVRITVGPIILHNIMYHTHNQSNIRHNYSSYTYDEGDGDLLTNPSGDRVVSFP